MGWVDHKGNMNICIFIYSNIVVLSNYVDDDDNIPH